MCDSDRLAPLDTPNSLPERGYADEASGTSSVVPITTSEMK
jgi:hypothetical protein